jgi:hypothetical protein
VFYDKGSSSDGWRYLEAAKKAPDTAWGEGWGEDMGRGLLTNGDKRD